MEHEHYPQAEQTGCSQEEWNQYQVYKQERDSRLGQLSGLALIEQHEKVLEMDQKLVEDYPQIERRQVLLWHFMCGSTPPPGKITTYDYPGGEISQFIETEILPPEPERTTT